MNVRLLAALAAVAGCSRAPAPACPTPTATGPTDAETEAEAEAEEETDDDEDIAGAMSVDGLFACSRPRGDLEVTLRAGYTAKDLVLSYMSISCTNVLLPVELADRFDKGGSGFHGRLKNVEIEPRYRALFEELGLSLVRKDGIAIIVDQSWLARRPGLILLSRVDPASMLLSSSPSVPPPLDTPEPGPLLAGITRVSDSHVIITRAAADAAIASNATKSARIIASSRNGLPNGVKLYAIRPLGIYAGLGIMNGDTVHTINGAAITGVADFTIDKLLGPSHVELSITRRGTSMTLMIDVSD